MKTIDISNQRFGRLVAIEKSSNIHKKTAWKCLCDCGNIVYVSTSNLTCGKIRSCGCIRREAIIKQNTTHNQRHTPLYEVWKSIRQRCYNSKCSAYKNYGARGITVCEEWKQSFQAFYNWAIENGYETGLCIERIDNDGNYCPENCKWATRKEQMRNTRRNRFIEYNGETKTLSEWCEILSLPYATINGRIHKGYSPQKAFETPIKSTR